MVEEKLRRAFGYLNRYLMVPMFRLGLAPFLGSPLGGYVMVLKTIGRKTGKVRYTPVNYAIANGNVYCLAGFGTISDWYRNLLAHPNIEVMMPSGVIAGTADTVTDPDERLRIIRQILINAGFAGFFYSYDPRTISDQRLLDSTRNAPVICIRPYGIGSGASDPGGWVWLISIATTLVFVRWLFRKKG